jgi:hypothetical protein
VAGSRADPPARFNPDRANVEYKNESRKTANIRLSFVGANPRPRLKPFGPLDTIVSYFIDNEPDQWRPGVPLWSGVRYVGAIRTPRCASALIPAIALAGPPD